MLGNVALKLFKIEINRKVLGWSKILIFKFQNQKLCLFSIYKVARQPIVNVAACFSDRN